jgi:hypothetical protein
VFLGSSASVTSISSKCSEWQEELQNDSDRSFLLNGIQNGFRVTAVGDATIVDAFQKNHKSASEHSDAVEAELLDQLKKGHYVIASEKPRIVSALAAIPKDDGGIRLIHDASKPSGKAMNDYSIPESVKFQTIKDACLLAKTGYWCAKVDLQSAYRSVCISPQDYCVTGLSWTFKGETDPTFLFDCRLPSAVM